MSGFGVQDLGFRFEGLASGFRSFRAFVSVLMFENPIVDGLGFTV